jgi:hypothetical protein
MFSGYLQLSGYLQKPKGYLQLSWYLQKPKSIMGVLRYTQYLQCTPYPIAE